MMSEIRFFGEVDLHPQTKKISSQYPAWYAERPMEELKERIDGMERALDRDEVPRDRLAEYKDDLRKQKERYDAIRLSVPKLSGTDKDRIAKIRSEMGEEIKSGYFTRDSMVKGTADAHKEAERMVKPMIDVKPEYGDILKACNVKITDGKVTRDGMVKAWKIVGKLLNRHGGDEDTNPEVLRRD
jgi:hypothetical protein